MKETIKKIEKYLKSINFEELSLENLKIYLSIIFDIEKEKRKIASDKMYEDLMQKSTSLLGFGFSGKEKE